LNTLVLDAGSRAAVESIQSLARRGVVVDAAANNTPLAFASRRLRHRLRQPPDGQADVFLQWLSQIDRDSAYTLIVPSTEISLRHFLSLQESDPLRQKAVLSSDASLKVALDKFETLQLASKLNVPIPDTILVEPGSPFPACDSYPVVLKPVSSLAFAKGVVKQLRARIARSEFERQEILDSMLQESAVLQQQLVPGYGVGIELLYRRGKLQWYFCHRRLHEGEGQPGLGGGSSYRESIAPDPELLRHATALLDALEWHGVAMVEYRVADDGSFWLMEINPRLWGSLALAIDAGVDFPYGLLCLASGQDIPAQPAYKVGYRTRLLWSDLIWIKNRLFHKPDSYAFFEILKLIGLIAGGESWDFFDWGDLAPTLEDFRRFASEKLQSAGNRLRESKNGKLARKLHEKNVQRIFRSQEEPRRILFLCYGNICRSPFAEFLAKSRYPSMAVQSAGFHANEGRNSPPHIQSLASRYSINLSDHRSRRVTAGMIRDADVVLLFDSRNYDHFCQEFPDETHKILLLGLFRQQPLLNIQDPYGFDANQTALVLQQISEAIDSVGVTLSDSFHRNLHDYGRRQQVS
jgi:protein-tyrosine-phosphatase/predicted ATP-grasp superfamily ATP-dependent carboligase